MSDWKIYYLDDIAEILNKIRVPLNSRQRSERKGEFPYYGASGIVDYVNDFLFDGEYVLISEDGENLKSRKTPIAFKANGKFWVNNHAHIVRGKKKFINDWLVYYFSLLDLAPYITGAVQPKLSKENLLSIPIPFPGDKVAERITGILSALDDKIAFNRRMNQTLEQMAQTLFRQYFVDGIDEGKLPKEWCKGEIKDICIVNSRSLAKKDKLDWLDYIEISAVGKGVINSITNYKRGEEPSRARRRLTHGDTVLSTVRPDRGSYFLAINPYEELIASTGFAVFTATAVPYTYLYLLLTQEDYIKYYGFIANGAAYPAINPESILNMEIAIPPKEVLDEFHSKVEALLLKIDVNNRESKTLATTRDTLLPKLMSGEIDVTNTQTDPLHEPVLS